MVLSIWKPLVHRARHVRFKNGAIFREFTRRQPTTDKTEQEAGEKFITRCRALKTLPFSNERP